MPPRCATYSSASRYAQIDFHLCMFDLNPKVDTPLFATTNNPLQPYHSPRAKILAFKSAIVIETYNPLPPLGSYWVPLETFVSHIITPAKNKFPGVWGGMCYSAGCYCKSKLNIQKFYLLSVTIFNEQLIFHEQECTRES